MATADKLITVAENVPKVYHAGQLNVVENAECLKGSKSDTAMLLDDISPVTHEMGVRVRGKNLLNQSTTALGTLPIGSPPTYIRDFEDNTWYAALTLSGYYDPNNNMPEYALNGDSITVKTGTTESRTLYGLSKALKCNPNTTYTLSYSMENGRTQKASGIGFYGADKKWLSFVYCDSGSSFTTPSNCYWVIVCFHGNTEGTYVTYSNIQLELGTTATAYTPYNSDIQNVHSKNLIPYPYAETTKTENGITFTDKGNGTITASGTATGQSYFYLFRNKTIKAGTYTLSGCASGGGSSTYKILSVITASDGTKSYWADYGSSTHKTFTEDATIDLRIQIENEQIVENLVFTPQLEYGLTATAYTKYHEPYPLVVSRYGKNLWDKDYASNLSNWYIIPNSSGYCRLRIKIPIGTQYTVSYQKTLSTGLGFYFNINNNHWMYHSSNAELIKNTITLTDSRGFIDVIMAGYPSLNTFMENIGNDLQIEISPTATAYEPYTSKTDYTPNSDGTVEGVENLYPSTSLLTNDPYGKVYIDCDYYKDIDKTFNELTTSVALSGGE